MHIDANSTGSPPAGPRGGRLPFPRPRLSAARRPVRRLPVIDALQEMLGFAFMQRALLAAVMVGLVGSFISFFVVLKRLAFIGAGISHAAFGEVAIGLHLGM